MTVQPNDIFSINNEEDFSEIALELFLLHYNKNSVYRSFCDLLYTDPSDVNRIEDIPFLPISFFKTHQVLLDDAEAHLIFESSGTTGANTSTHYIHDTQLYEQSFTKGFQHFFGNPEDYIILALLPSYLERSNSSLIYMVEHLIKQTKSVHSGFYLNNIDELKDKLLLLEKQAGKPVLLIGVSFALLDFVEQHPMNLKRTIILETGGMKGRRKELVKEELHHQLIHGFGVTKIYSEYGMTELMSQAYSSGHNIFECPPWMKVLTRDTEDALTLLPPEQSGGINVIDLANYYSCPFIATQDLGKIHADGSFEIIGRFDHADIRGCNLLVF